MKHTRWIVLLGGALTAAACMAAPAAQAADSAPVRSITVSGSGELSAPADTAFVNIGIDTNGPSAQEAARDNADTMAGIRNAVIAAGVQEKEVKTDNYGLWPNYQTDKNGKTLVSGYRATNTMKVTVADIGNTGKVVDAAIKAGANRINSIEFSLKNKDAYKQDVLAKAVKDAREKADTIASALGKRVVNVISVTEGSVGFTPVYRMRMAVSDMAAGNAATPVDPQDVTVESQVSVVFEIQ